MAFEATETLWLNRIIDIDQRETPDGRILLIGMQGGRQYAIPLVNPIVRQAVFTIASPITIANQIPSNGSGAS